MFHALLVIPVVRHGTVMINRGSNPIYQTVLYIVGVLKVLLKGLEAFPRLFVLLGSICCCKNAHAIDGIIKSPLEMEL